MPRKRVLQERCWKPAKLGCSSIDGATEIILRINKSKNYHDQWFSILRRSMGRDVPS
jgi:hypothetical protein